MRFSKKKIKVKKKENKGKKERNKNIDCKQIVAEFT